MEKTGRSIVRRCAGGSFLESTSSLLLCSGGLWLTAVQVRSAEHSASNWITVQATYSPPGAGGEYAFPKNRTQFGRKSRTAIRNLRGLAEFLFWLTVVQVRSAEHSVSNWITVQATNSPPAPVGVYS